MDAKPALDGTKPAAAPVSMENTYQTAVRQELQFLEAWRNGLVSPVWAAVRVRQIRDARLVEIPAITGRRFRG